MTNPSPMLPIEEVRSRFPALHRRENGREVAYLDGPGGTQMPQIVIDAMASVLENGISNLGGGYGASIAADEVTASGRKAMADFLNADPGEIVFGQNMTSLTFATSRAIARDWGPGDRVIVTTLDHDANVTPWREAAREAGAEVISVEFDPVTGLLDPDAVIDAMDERTRLVAITAASNALGSVTDLAPIVAAARRHPKVHVIGATNYLLALLPALILIVPPRRDLDSIDLLILLGGTIVFWLGLLVWAFRRFKKPEKSE